ncbi:TetR/AcrR family transcriptional regulator [Embleya sp. NPDC020886]|uniref:TetR/AcrR family transcriptional regulator n=1 Tax=Embleya sp. NPDC020886 TaxID=3363980 RepID=UPI0037A3C6A3
MAVRKAARHYATGLSRRAQILDAADGLFRESGFGSPSLREIAKAAGLSHPGLLRYFASKEELLDALLDRYEGAARAPGGPIAGPPPPLLGDGPAAEPEAGTPAEPPGPDRIVAAARRNAAVAGYPDLVTALGGEATRADHPAHARMGRRYRELRAWTEQMLSTAVPAGGLRAEADRVVAGWEGLQLLALYDPSGIDVAACLERYLHGLGPEHAANTAPAAPPRWTLDELVARDAEEFDRRTGYASGRERRARILDAATALFGARGFHGISMREVAKAVGISHSTLLYHFDGKDELLHAVLARQDYLTISLGAVAGDTGLPGRLSAVVEASRRVAYETPGLRELFSVLSGEAVAPGHPAHAYFEKHFAVSRRYFTTIFEHLAARGELAPGRGPEQEAVWLLALCEGLQQQRLYDPEIDPPGLLATSIGRVLDVPAPPAG